MCTTAWSRRGDCMHKKSLRRPTWDYKASFTLRKPICRDVPLLVGLQSRPRAIKLRLDAFSAPNQFYQT